MLLQNENDNIPEQERTNYEPTDEFRAIQEESRGLSHDEIKAFHDDSKQVDEKLRNRLSDVFKRELESRSSRLQYASQLLNNPKTNKQLKLYQNIDADTFHDIFEIVQKYLPKGDAVDIHEASDYINNKNYLTSDGLSGFSITPEGDLISVFSLGETGFLRTIQPIIQKQAKTLDCFNSKLQPLQDMYSKTLGFKTASVLDFNYDILVEFKGKEYADYFVKTYGESPVAFMINTNKAVETKHFNKEQYDEAKDYQQSFIDAKDIYHQTAKQKKINGYFDSDLKVIVLGENLNNGTLPHEMAHFFLDRTFELWRDNQGTKEFRNYFDRIAEFYLLPKAGFRIFY